VTDQPARPAHRARQVAGVFVRLGLTSFGGPAAHTAMMHDEVVRRRRWVAEERFVDLLGASNLVPGPSSTELAILLGWERAGRLGLALAGLGFIVPAAVIVGILAWAYVEYGTNPRAEALLYGIKPVVVAIVAAALVRLTPRVARTWPLAGLAVAATAGYLVGINELAVLGAAGLLAAGWKHLHRTQDGRPLLWLPIGAAVTTADVELGRVFLVFLKIGAVLYGSGYVLFAFLQGELVDRLGWLTDEQLLDAVAVGQATPGPLFTTATFVGYLLGGTWGAVVATVGIFLPSFVFVAALTRLVTWIRSSATLGAALDGVNAAAIGLIAGFGIQFAGEAIVDAITLAIALGAGLALWRTRLNSAWLIGAGAAIGLAAGWAGWVG
jgi:chromate transporter